MNPFAIRRRALCLSGFPSRLGGRGH